MPPITGLDHLTLNVQSLETSIADYAQLLGRPAHWRGLLSNTSAAVFQLSNLLLYLRESAGPEGLNEVCFRVDNADRMHRRLQRLGVDLKEQRSDPLCDVPDIGAADSIVATDMDATRGLSFSFVARKDGAKPAREDNIYALDHLVIESSDATATAFLLAAQLGLDMRADISRPQWGARLLFFRCGDLIVEVMQKLEEQPQIAAQDHFYGLSWRCKNAADTHRQLTASHFDISDLRDGRKPGTQVFTVRDRTSGVPTLVLEPSSP